MRALVAKMMKEAGEVPDLPEWVNPELNCSVVGNETVNFFAEFPSSAAGGEENETKIFHLDHLTNCSSSYAVTK